VKFILQTECTTLNTGTNVKLYNVNLSFSYQCMQCKDKYLGHKALKVEVFRILISAGAFCTAGFCIVEE